jgi:hypothetical protein
MSRTCRLSGVKREQEAQVSDVHFEQRKAPEVVCAWLGTIASQALSRLSISSKKLLSCTAIAFIASAA